MELMKTYHFNDVIDERLRSLMIESIRNNNLDPKLLFEHIESIYQQNCSYMNNPAAYLFKVFKGLDLTKFKLNPRNVVFPIWKLGTENFRGFIGDEVDRYLFGRVIEHVINTRQRDPGAWVSNLIQKMDEYCKRANIHTWRELLNLLVTNNALSGCNIPLEELRIEVTCSIKDWEELLEELDSIPVVVDFNER